MNREEDAFRDVPALKLEEGEFHDTSADVVIESGLQIIVDDTPLAAASIMPGMEHEFVTGYLFNQAFIAGLEDIASIKIEDDVARVSLKKPLDAPGTSYRIVSGGGQSAYARAPLPRITSDLKLRSSTVFTAMDRLFETAEVYKETEGVHAAGLFTAQAEPLCVAEDIGRHNCLDKVIGFALLNGVDTGICLLASTGRMASEMVSKICRAGIPVAATKTAVTDRGVEIAEKCGVTLIGFVRNVGAKIHTDMETRTIESPIMKIYSGAERIAC